jgi:hypothetical protein
MRIMAGNLESAVVARADLKAARDNLCALVLELEHMRLLLGIEL